MSARTHIVLAGHGSRSPEANASLTELARGMATQLDVPVSAAFLEMSEPAIPAALRAAAAAGAQRIVVLPYFLSPGMHVRRDLVAIAADMRRELNLPIDIAAFFGAHPDVPRLLIDIAQQAL